MGPKADQLRALREAKMRGGQRPSIEPDKLRKIVQAKTSTKTKPKASAAGQPKENPMISITTNSHASSRPQTLAAPGQTPREQVDEALAKTAAGAMPDVPAFLNQTAGKTPAELKAITAENAKKGAKARATGPKLKATRTTAPMLPKSVEPAGKAILKEQQKKEAKVKRAKTAKKKTAKAVARKAAGKPAAKAAPKTPAKAKASQKASGKPRTTVPGQAVADFMARKGGASMAELEKEFGIDAHPMRAKVYYVRHTLGYDVETKDGRYYATAPKAKKA